MSKRRGDQSQEDSLDLLLDTVSNVFGGVMFLTLLAALLILSRGAPVVDDPEIETTHTRPVSTTLIEAEARRAAVALAAQQRTQQRLDPDGSIADKIQRLAEVRSTLTLARRHTQRADRVMNSQQQAQYDQQAAESDLQKQIQDLEKELAKQDRVAGKIRSAAERTVEFRPLSRSMTDEAVVILRYGRWYMLQYGKNSTALNTDDFFVVREGEVSRVTPKPHKGQPVNEQTLPKLAKTLKDGFPAHEFHVVIAVWDDSFAEFNPLKDAIKEAGFQYRTLPCDSSSRLSNRYAAEAYVQ